MLSCSVENIKFKTSPSLMFSWEIYEFFKTATELGEQLPVH